MSLEAAFRVDLAAWCRDCGAEILDWERRLRNADAPTTFEDSDDGGGTVALVTKRGACDKCGSGRAAVRLGVQLDEGEEESPASAAPRAR